MFSKQFKINIYVYYNIKFYFFFLNLYIYIFLKTPFIYIPIIFNYFCRNLVDNIQLIFVYVVNVFIFFKAVQKLVLLVRASYDDVTCLIKLELVSGVSLPNRVTFTLLCHFCRKLYFKHFPKSILLTHTMKLFLQHSCQPSHFGRDSPDI